MKPILFVGVMMLCVAGWSSLVLAQYAESSEQVSDVGALPSEPASLPPGEEVMRPTAHGVRFTRRMADGIGRTMVRHQLTRNMTIDDQRKEQLARIVSDRAWDLKQRYGPQGATAVETFYEMLLRQAGAPGTTFTPEQARAFSEKVGPGSRIVREFWEGILDDADPILDDAQFEELEKEADQALKLNRRFEQKMERWSRGEVGENESLFDGMSPDDEDSSATEGQRGKSREYQRAERTARWATQNLGPETWRRFLADAGRMLDFDAEQKAEGEEILRDYTRQAEEIMTREWRAKVLANRVQEQIRRMVPDEPLEPWVFHLDMEYKKLTGPVQKLGRAFRAEIISLADADQIELIADELRKVGRDHGMAPEELTAIMHLFPEPQTQPEAD